MTRSGNLTASVTVVVFSTGGSDVAPFQQLLSFGPNVLSATVAVPIVNDGQPGEPAANIPLTLSSPGAGAVLGAQRSSTLVVVDDNPLPPVETITSLTTPTVRVTTGSGRKAKSKTETAIELTFSGAVAGAGNVGAYQLYAGKTKKRVTSYSQRVPLGSATYNPSSFSVILLLAGTKKLSALNQLQVSTSSITDDYGRPVDAGAGFVGDFGKGGTTITQARVESMVAAMPGSLLKDVHESRRIFED